MCLVSHAAVLLHTLSFVDGCEVHPVPEATGALRTLAAFCRPAVVMAVAKRRPTRGCAEASRGERPSGSASGSRAAATALADHTGADTGAAGAPGRLRPSAATPRGNHAGANAGTACAPGLLRPIAAAARTKRPIRTPAARGVLIIKAASAAVAQSVAVGSHVRREGGGGAAATASAGLPPPRALPAPRDGRQSPHAPVSARVPRI